MAVMVRCGMVDSNDPPTPNQPILPACPVCNQRDANCPTCGGRGTFRVEHDPTNTIPAMAYRVAEFADQYIEHGLPLVAGGMLDQANWFASAASFCVADRKRNLSERYGDKT